MNKKQKYTCMTCQIETNATIFIYWSRSDLTRVAVCWDCFELKTKYGLYGSEISKMIELILPTK